MSNETYSLNDIFVFKQDEEDANKGAFEKVGSLHKVTIDKLVRFGIKASVAETM